MSMFASRTKRPPEAVVIHLQSGQLVVCLYAATFPCSNARTQSPTGHPPSTHFPSIHHPSTSHPPVRLLSIHPPTLPSFFPSFHVLIQPSAHSPILPPTHPLSVHLTGLICPSCQRPARGTGLCSRPQRGWRSRLSGGKSRRVWWGDARGPWGWGSPVGLWFQGPEP